MPVVVMRCQDGPAAVPSRVVTCSRCGCDCWLSKASGDATLALAREDGDGRVLCLSCVLLPLLADDPPTART